MIFAPSGTAKLLEATVVKAIDAATQTVDVAMYQFTSQDIADALVAAKKRGVQVRMLVDGNEAKVSKQSKDGFVQAAGINLKRVATSGGTYGWKFHHKFAVLDGKTLLVGSYNWTENADEVNYENLVTLTDAAIVKAYEQEFESLVTSGKGGVASGADEVFAPTGKAKGLESRIVSEIAAAKTEIVIAMYQFTSTEVSKALLAAIQRGVKVSILLDAKVYPLSKDAVSPLVQAGAQMKKVVLGGSGMFAAEFHDKYAAIDGATVITGSYNWSPNQDQKGYENILVLHDASLAKQYVANFAQIWSSKVAH